MKRKVVAFLVVELALVTVASAQGQQAWVARYDGAGHDNDSAFAITVDGAGNIIVTGSSVGSGTTNDFATIKYDTNGNQLWVARYDGPVNGNDYARAMAVDNTDNVYVTGLSEGFGTGFDIATIKYDTNGNQLWVARYKGSTPDQGLPSAIVLDGIGNVYVTGTSRGSDTGNDYSTIKYDSNGNELWAARYNGSDNSDDSTSAIALDRAGNVLVTGRSFAFPGDDYATVKYDANGNKVWVARYNGPDEWLDSATALALDNTGNVYVTGLSGPPFSFDSEMATVKYDTSGHQLWVARYQGADSFFNRGLALALDKTGNVYVAGDSFDGADLGYAIVKYDAVGNQLWVAHYTCPGGDGDAPFAIIMDSAGNVYVTGVCDRNSSVSDYATVKFDANGTRLWAARYNGSGFGRDFANAIAVDRGGNVYVTGWSGTYPNRDYATVKYGQTAVAGAPVIITPPRNQTVSAGADATLGVEASGTAPVSYQWRFNGIVLPGATNAALVLTNVQLSQVGYYGVAVSNSVGVAVSADVRLLISSQTGSQLRLASTNVLSDGQFQFTLVGNPGLNYSIQGSTNLMTWTALTNFVSATGTNEFTDVISNFNRRFYRAVSP
jgi:hypothetical protein